MPSASFVSVLMYGSVTLLQPCAADGSGQSTGGLIPVAFALQVTSMYLK
jgi:hypothetical protein